MSQCYEPQAHPDRCGCRQKSAAAAPMFADYSVIRNDMLPAKTMVVSADVFELLRQYQPTKEACSHD